MPAPSLLMHVYACLSPCACITAAAGPCSGGVFQVRTLCGRLYEKLGFVVPEFCSDHTMKVLQVEALSEPGWGGTEGCWGL